MTVSREAGQIGRQQIVRRHGLYSILISSENGRFRAVARAGELEVASLAESTLDAAAGAVASLLDERRTVLQARRGADGAPLVEEYREALAATAPDMQGRLGKMLRAHGACAGATASAATLGRLVGADEGAVWREYGRFGRKISAWLKTGDTLRRNGEARFTVEPFAEVACAAEGSPRLLTLRPTFLKALQT